MDIKVLIGILNRPWFIEPTQAHYWAGVADSVLMGGNVPFVDKRDDFTRRKDYGSVYRIDENGNVNATGSIQVFRMDAPVTKYDMCGTPGSTTWVQLLHAAYADNSIDAVLIIGDSPGGQADGTEAVDRAIQARNKPVVTFAEMICSAMYWIASGSDEIIATDANNGFGASIGSIGTMCIVRDFSAKMEKDGIKEHLVFADASSDKWGDYFATIKGDYTELKKSLNGFNDSFLGSVKSNRGDKLKLDKENVLTGKVYNADDAVKYGLADAKGDFLYAVKRAATLGRKHKLQQRATMSTKNAAFQSALIAAKATAFAVVDGGFLLTEEHLNNIDAMLEQNNTVISTLSGQVKSLEAKAVDSTEMAANLTKANADLVQANADLTKAKADLVEAQGQIESFKKGAGMFSGAAAGTKDEDPPLENGNEEVDLSQLEHNRTADAFFGKPTA